MKLQTSNLFRLAASGGASLALAQGLHAATVLTGTGLADNTTVPATHGSNAVGTPNVSLAWSPAGAGGWQNYTAWPNGGATPGAAGDVYQLDGPSGNNAYTGAITFRIAFTPSSPTVAVLLNSVTLNDYVGPGTVALQNTILDWSVIGSVSGTLGSGTGVIVNDGTVSNLALGLQGTGGEVLTLSFRPTGGAGSYFAIDNLSFNQVTIPEPSGLALAAVGLGALALRRRRK